MQFSLPKLIGHRGTAAMAPENTAASFISAAKHGLKWVEFDVMLAADGEVVVIHDDSINRTTNAKGFVADMTYAELAACDAGSWFSPEFVGERISSLKEVIVLLSELGLGANIELKPCLEKATQTARAVVQCLDSLWPTHLAKPLLSSFEPLCLQVLADMNAPYPLALLMNRWRSDWRTLADDYFCVSIHVRERSLTRRRIAMIHASGKMVGAYTVNTVRRARTLSEWGIDTMFTDYPDRLVPLFVDSSQA